MRKIWIPVLTALMVLSTWVAVDSQQLSIPLGNALLRTDDTGALTLDTSAGACTLPLSNPRPGGNIRVQTDANQALVVCGNFGSGGGGDVSSDTIWNAAGDLVIGTGSDTSARLAKGSALQYLRTNAGGTTLEWATFAITSANITDGVIVNADVSGSAAIAFSKLNIALSDVLGLYTGTPNGAKFLRDDGAWTAIPGGGDALVANPLSQFAATTAAQFFGVISNEGTGFETFFTTPTLTNFGSLVTGEGTGVITALGVNVGSAGAFVVFNGAGGTPSSLTLTSATGLPVSTGLTGAGTGVLTALGVNVGSAGAFITFNGAGGTPSSMTLTSATGLPLSTGVTGDLPFANLTQCATDTVLSNTTAGTADVSCVAYATLLTDMGVLSFTDPNADGILVWDDSLGALVPAVIGSGLSFDGTTLTAAGGGLGSSLTSTTNDILASSGNDVVLGKSAGEAITLGFATSNTLTLSSTTGLNAINFGSMTATGLVYDAEGSSNTLTIPTKIQFNAGVCQNATASLGFSTPTTLGAVAGCHSVAAASGDPAYGFATFPTGGANTEVHGQFEVPSDWTGAIDVTLKWNAISTTANDVVWTINFGCVADSEAATAISFNATAFTAVTNKGTTLQFSTSTKTGITTTGCAAGETAFFIISRDTDTAGDTLDQDVQLISAVFTVRRAM